MPVDPSEVMGATGEAITPLAYDQNSLGGNPFIAGLVNAAKSVGQEALGVLRFPGDVVAGKYSLDQITQMAPGEALGLAAMGVGMPKPPGSLGIFGGERAAAGAKPYSFDHDVDSLGQARELEWEMSNSPSHVADGLVPTPDERYAIGQKVFDQTGWYRGADTKWRFVIPDEDAAFNDGAIVNDNKAIAQRLGIPEDRVAPTMSLRGGVRPDEPILKLPDVLDHPDLFEAYPFLKDVKVSQLVSGNVKGQYSNGLIELAPGNPVNVMSTMLHEIQHAVQEHEGFARGGSVEEFRQEGLPEATANKAYAQLAGEVEARHVQRLYEGGYAGHYPPETEQQIVPRPRQILRFYRPSYGDFTLEPTDRNPFGD